MINEEMNFTKTEGKVYEPIPERAYNVELLDIVLEEKPVYTKPGQPKSEELEKTLNFKFAILKGTDAKGGDLRGRFISQNYVQTTFYIGKNGKNKLYNIVESLLGRPLTQVEEAEGLSTAKMNSLIGMQCGVVIKQKSKDNKTYSNIESFYVADMRVDRLADEEKKELLEVLNKPKGEEKKENSASVEEDNFDNANLENIPF